MSDDLIRLSPAMELRYRIERELGRGGMGAVYLASDLRLGRLVALKVLPPEFAGDEGLRERFLRETRTAASFSHPNVVPVHAVEEDGRSLAFVMGYVEGESLTARVARSGPLDVRATVRLLQDVGYALAYAHGRGVVHRDIKPDNIMIERATGRAMVMDFGISRAMTPAADTPGLTRVGEIVGTPEYMSPEQATADNVDGRSDLYSLGLVALFAITARAPMGGGSAQQIIVRQLTEALPPAASLRPDLPPALAEAIDRCVAKDPSQRFATAEALVEALDNARLAGPEIPLTIRLFAQEAGTLGLIFAFFTMVSYLLFRLGASDDLSTLDSLIPVVMLSGVVLMRVLQAHSAAARLGAAGYAAGDVLAGFQAILDERLIVRNATVNDPAVKVRRRNTIIVAVLMIPASVVLIRIARDMRVQIGPTQFTSGPQAIIMFYSALLLFGMSFVLLIRSPYRMPIGERLFRAVWLGPIGRLFLRSAIRKRDGAAPATTAPRQPSVAVARATPRAAPVVAATKTDPALTDRLDRIETLITRLSERIDTR